MALDTSDLNAERASAPDHFADPSPFPERHCI